MSDCLFDQNWSNIISTQYPNFSKKQFEQKKAKLEAETNQKKAKREAEEKQMLINKMYLDFLEKDYQIKCAHISFLQSCWEVLKGHKKELMIPVSLSVASSVGTSLMFITAMWPFGIIQVISRIPEPFLIIISGVIDLAKKHYGKHIEINNTNANIFANFFQFLNDKNSSSLNDSILEPLISEVKDQKLESIDQIQKGITAYYKENFENKYLTRTFIEEVINGFEDKSVFNDLNSYELLQLVKTYFEINSKTIDQSLLKSLIDNVTDSVFTKENKKEIINNYIKENLNKLITNKDDIIGELFYIHNSRKLNPKTVEAIKKVLVALHFVDMAFGALQTFVLNTVNVGSSFVAIFGYAISSYFTASQFVGVFKEMLVLSGVKLDKSATIFDTLEAGLVVIGFSMSFKQILSSPNPNLWKAIAVVLITTPAAWIVLKNTFGKFLSLFKEKTLEVLETASDKLKITDKIKSAAGVHKLNFQIKNFEGKNFTHEELEEKKNELESKTKEFDTWKEKFSEESNQDSWQSIQSTSKNGMASVN